MHQFLWLSRAVIGPSIPIGANSDYQGLFGATRVPFGTISAGFFFEAPDSRRTNACHQTLVGTACELLSKRAEGLASRVGPS